MFGWDDVVVAGIGLFGNWFGAKKQASAAEKAAQYQAAAAKYTADLQEKARKEALAFDASQATNAFENNEVARRSNYDSLAARERRLGFLGDEVGLGPREIPAYLPGVRPDFSMFGGAPTGAATGGGGGTRPLASIDPNQPIGPQIAQYFKSQGVSDQETPYWVSKWNELTARGQQLNDPQYAVKRLAAADVFGGGGGSGPAATKTGRSIALPGATPFMNVIQPIGFYAG